jgi:hypothetical protein
MAYIPQMNIQPLRMPGQAGWGTESFLNALGEKKDEIKQTNRLKNKAIETSLEKLSMSELLNTKNSELAQQAYDKITETMTNAMMTNKGNDFWGPQIDDKEYADIMNQIKTLDGYITGLRNDEKLVAEQEKIYRDEYLNDKGTFDLKLSARNFKNYWETGEKPEDGMFLVPNGVPSSTWMSDSKYYTKEQSQPHTLADGTRVFPDAPDDYKLDQYQRGMQNYANRKGLAEEMVTPLFTGYANEKDVKAIDDSLNGVLASAGFTDRGAIERKKMEMTKKLFETGKLDPLLGQAAEEWGYRTGKYKQIAKGYSSRNDKTSAEDTANIPQTPKTYNINGIEVKGVDLSRSSKTTLSNYQPPEGSYAMRVTTPKSEKEQLNAEIAKAQRNGDKKRVKELQKQVATASTTTSPRVDKTKISATTTADYEVVTYGKDPQGKSVVVMKQKDYTNPAGIVVKGEYIITPLEGQEELLKQINKNFKQPTEDTGKKEIEWETE